MALVQWRLAQFPRRLVNRCKEFTSWLILLRQTLFYNEFTSYMVALETAAEPLFWAVEKFSRYFGPVRLYFFMESNVIYRYRISCVFLQTLCLFENYVVLFKIYQKLILPLPFRSERFCCML